MTHTKAQLYINSQALLVAAFGPIIENKAMIYSPPEEVAERLKKAMSDAGISNTALADAMDVSVQAVGHWRKTGKIARERVSGIAAACRVSVEWLLTGKSEAKEDRSRYDVNTEPGPDIRGFVPLISWVQAGSWTAAADPYEVGDAEQWVPCPITHGHNTFVLRVRGESMEPEYRDGDWIFVDPDRHPENGAHVVVRMEDAQEATFKKMVIEGGERFLMALNPAWPERVIKINGNATIVGVVIFSGKPRV